MTNIKSNILPRLSVLSLTILLIITGSSVRSENLKLLKDLEGSWKFSIGDDPSWAHPDYNDNEWEYVFVPRSWESNGFVDYDGFAWYRKVFRMEDHYSEGPVFLNLGKIDDVDEVYFNGHLIGGTGVFPPLVRTAYSVNRKYPIPTELINYQGVNTIAIRVFDEYLDGGIYSGEVGIYFDEDNELLSYNLAGYWDFETQIKIDNHSDKIYGMSHGSMYVPAYWESMGYSQYDGLATYSRNFTIPSNFNLEDMKLVLGYIDDVDKVYINGKLIATVDQLVSYKNRDVPESHLLRAYDFPKELVKKGTPNRIEIKVYDTGGTGGIYEGPIGFITENNLKRLKDKQVEKPYNVWEEFIKSFFE